MFESGFPEAGSSARVVMDELRASKSADVDWRSGRTNMYVQFGGDDVLDVARSAATLFHSENAHGLAAFPSVAKLQAEVIDWMLSLVNGGPLSDGCFTGGGSESILMSLKVARDWARTRRPDLLFPKVLIPQSAHPAFEKAGELLGLEIVRTPLRADLRADTDLMRAQVCSRTIMVAGSAPQFGHGVVDPINDIAAIALRHNLWMHVDACIGAMIAPFIRSAGADVPSFDFSVEGVRSISADIHKYGFGAKGASTALFRNRSWRHSYTFEFDDWPIGSYTSTGIAGTKSAAPIAAAWAVMKYLGRDGYVRIASEILETSRRLQSGLQAIEGIELVSQPDLPILAWRTPGSPIGAMVAAMTKRGWFLRPMARPEAIHMGMISMHQGPAVDEYLESVRSCAAELLVN